jgi:hypothetical protein
MLVPAGICLKHDMKKICRIVFNVLLNIYVAIRFAGYGVFACRAFEKGDFLMIYNGDLITEVEAILREKVYKQNNEGCFVYYFTDNGVTMW